MKHIFRPILAFGIRHLRSTLLVANVALTAALAGAWWVAAPSRPGGPGIDPWPDLSRYRPDPDRTSQARRVGDMTAVAARLQPPRPRPVSALDAGESPVPPPAPEPEPAVAGGPLAESWEYISCFHRPDHPRRSRGVIRRKADAKRTSAGSSRRIVRRTSRTTTRRTTSSRSSRRTTSRRSRSAGTTVSFRVGERHILREDLELDFWVESADPERLVYWIDGETRPSRYVLERSRDSLYDRRGKVRHLEPQRPRRAGHGVTARRSVVARRLAASRDQPADEQRSHFIVRPEQPVDVREVEYAEAIESAAAD